MFLNEPFMTDTFGKFKLSEKKLPKTQFSEKLGPNLRKPTSINNNKKGKF